MDRRHMLQLYLVGGTAALLASGCTQQQVTDLEKKVADVINQVQAGVAAACSTVGKLIPTANSVFAVLVGILGSSNVVISTAVMIATAISEIAAVGCAAPAPTGAVSGTTKSGVPVTFY